MTLFSTMTKKTLVAAVIAATGLPASMAAAQFKVDYSAKADTAKVAGDEDKKTVMVYTDHDDEHVYKIKIVNGVIELANIDGKELDHKLVDIQENVIVFLTEDGKALHEIKLHKLPNAPHAPHAPHGTHTIDLNTDGEHTTKVWSSSTGGDFEFDANSNVFFTTSDAPEDGTLVVKGEIAPPKVMLGINLGEPSKALRKHLKLKDGMQVIFVERVIDGLPAAKAGLEDFDVIMSIDGSDEANGEILSKVLSTKDAGEVMKLVVLRSGDKVKLKVKLEEYNAQALGTVVVTRDAPEWTEDEREIEFAILDQIENGKFGDVGEIHLKKLKEELHKQLAESGVQREIAIEMREKAMEAMKDAERQMMEFRDGKLIVRSGEEMDRRVREFTTKLHERLPDANPEVLHSHLQEVDERLRELEERLNRQMDNMSVHMDRLTVMFERLMNTLEDND
jgi:hypothetical protein